jgi:hypothetical protein
MLPVTGVLDRVRLYDAFDVRPPKFHQLTDVQIVVGDPTCEHFPGCYGTVLRCVGDFPIGCGQTLEPFQRILPLEKEFRLHFFEILLVVLSFRHPFVRVDGVPFSALTVQDEIQVLAEILAFLIVKVAGHFENRPCIRHQFDLGFFLGNVRQQGSDHFCAVVQFVKERFEFHVAPVITFQISGSG